MAFMSLFVIFLLCIVAFFGFVLFVIGVVTLIIRAIRKANGRQVKTVSLVLGIIATVFSLVLMSPGIILIIGVNVADSNKKLKFENLENKYYVDYSTWSEGFDYNGVQLVPVDFIHCTKEVNTSVVANIVFEDKYYSYELKLMENEGNYDIYSVGSYVMVDEGKVEEIKDFYSNQCSVTMLFSTKGENYDSEHTCDFDKEMFLELYSNYENSYPDVSKLVDQRLSKFSIELKSTDGLYYHILFFSEYEDGIIMEDNINNTVVNGYSLTAEQANYVSAQYEINK